MKHLILAGALALVPIAATAQSAKEIALAGFDALFINPNPEALSDFFAEDYIQHNPQIPSGLDPIRGFAANLPEGFKAEVGNVIADEETGLVAMHVRYTGFSPTPMIAVDIFRVEDGKIVEHWDVLQAEVTETVSGNPMWTPAIE